MLSTEQMPFFVAATNSKSSVVFAGSNEEGQNDISNRSNIVAIETEGRQTLGFILLGVLIVLKIVSRKLGERRHVSRNIR